jgi:nitrous oxide reductase accessory protein NosL
MKEKVTKEEYNCIMKKFTPLLIVFLFVGLIVALFLSLGKVQKMVVIKEGNLQKIPLEIVLNKYQDSDCGMVIEDITYASEVIAPDGKTWFFHDHGGFVHWLEDKSFKDKAIIWVHTKDTKKWIDAKKAWYSLNDITPMGYGFGAYEKKEDNFVDFSTMRLKMLRGETMNDPKIRKRLLGK